MKNRITFKQLKKLVNEGIGSKVIRLGSGAGYYGDAPNIRIHEENGIFVYEFSEPGWDFDTHSQLEAAALIAGSKFRNSKELEEIPFEQPSGDDWTNAAYWISGGNRLWKFGSDEYFVGNWDEACDAVANLLEKECGPKVSGCNTLLDLIKVFVGVKENFIAIMYDELPELWEFDDEDDDTVEVTEKHGDKNNRGWRKNKKPVKESDENSGRMRYFVKSYEAETEEDVYERGLNGKSGSFWTSRDLPVEGRFSTIEDVLKAVSEKNGFDYVKDNWAFDEYNGWFFGDFLVDENNIEADKSEIEAWKNGEKRLWDCRISVHIMKSLDAVELDDSETQEWVK